VKPRSTTMDRVEKDFQTLMDPIRIDCPPAENNT
jgi:hypothetical protein